VGKRGGGPLEEPELARCVKLITEQLARLAPGIRSRLGPPHTEASIVAIEKELGFELPAGYRRFLIEIGDPDEMKLVGRGHWLSRGVVNAIRLSRASLDRPFALSGSRQIKKKPPGGELRDGCVRIGETELGEDVMLVLRGEPRQRGTVWLDRSENGGGFMPTGDDFLRYALHSIARLAEASYMPSASEAASVVANLDPSAQLASYADAKWLGALLERDDRFEHVTSLFERVPGAEPQIAAIASRTLGRAIGLERAVALAIQTRSGAVPIPTNSTNPTDLRFAWKLVDLLLAVSWKSWPNGVDPELYAAFAGEWERASEIANSALEQSTTYAERVRHACHALVAATVRGQDPTRFAPEFEFVGTYSGSRPLPTYSGIAQEVFARLLVAQSADVARRALDALPAEVSVQLLTGEIRFGNDDKHLLLRKTQSDPLGYLVSFGRTVLAQNQNGASFVGQLLTRLCNEWPERTSPALRQLRRCAADLLDPQPPGARAHGAG
jgi:hypothetical protein